MFNQIRYQEIFIDQHKVDTYHALWSI